MTSVAWSPHVHGHVQRVQAPCNRISCMAEVEDFDYFHVAFLMCCGFCFKFPRAARVHCAIFNLSVFLFYHMYMYV